MDEQDWVDDMHEKHHDLFETYLAETSDGFYKKGQILRGIECGDGWKWIIEQFLEEVQWLRKHRLRITNPDFTSEKYINDNGEYVWKESPTITIPLEENQVKLFQIKEKFGQLRIYITSHLPHMTIDLERAVAKAEARAGLICQKCGCVGNSDGSRIEYTTGWVTLLCDRCVSKKENV